MVLQFLKTFTISLYYNAFYQQIIDLSSNISDLSTGVAQVNSQMQETSSQLTGGYDASSTDVSDIPQATGLD